MTLPTVNGSGFPKVAAVIGVRPSMVTFCGGGGAPVVVCVNDTELGEGSTVFGGRTITVTGTTSGLLDTPGVMAVRVKVAWRVLTLKLASTSTTTWLGVVPLLGTGPKKTANPSQSPNVLPAVLDLTLKEIGVPSELVTCRACLAVPTPEATVKVKAVSLTCISLTPFTILGDVFDLAAPVTVCESDDAASRKKRHREARILDEDIANLPALANDSGFPCWLPDLL